MAISTTIYSENDELVLVEVSINGNPVGICAEDSVDTMLHVLGLTE